LLVADWDQVLAGGVTSTFSDGPVGPRVLPNGSRLDLAQATAQVNCGKPMCSVADMDAVTVERPWGANNPQWQLYAHGNLDSLSAPGSIDSRLYVIVWVADDPLENDGQPLVDGDTSNGVNPGDGLLQLLAHAYGPAGARRVVEATMRRAGLRVGVISWREVR